MNRRRLLTLLSSVPLLGFLKPEAPICFAIDHQWTMSGFRFGRGDRREGGSYGTAKDGAYVREPNGTEHRFASRYRVFFEDTDAVSFMDGLRRAS